MKPYRFYCKSRKVWMEIPRGVWDQLRGPYPPDGWVCGDLCTMSPDIFAAFYSRKIANLWWACLIHDYHYQKGAFGGGKKGRKKADKYFRENIKFAMRYAGYGRIQTARVAARYYWGVRIAGGPHYQG